MSAAQRVDHSGGGQPRRDADRQPVDPDFAGRRGLFQPIQQPQQAVEDRQQMRRATGDEQIDRHDRAGAGPDFAAISFARQRPAFRHPCRADGGPDLSPPFA